MSPNSDDGNGQQGGQNPPTRPPLNLPPPRFPEVLNVPGLTIPPADAVGITGAQFSVSGDTTSVQPVPTMQSTQSQATASGTGNQSRRTTRAPPIPTQTTVATTQTGSFGTPDDQMIVLPNTVAYYDELDKTGYWSNPEGKPIKMSLQNPTSKFDGKNFASYREMLFPYLRAYNCVGIIEGTELIPSKSNDPAQQRLRDDWKKRHNLVEILLMNTLRDSDRILLSDKRLVAAKWKDLQLRYELKPYVSKGKAFAKLFDTVWDPKKESGEEFLNRLAKMRLELAAMGRKITDEDMGDAIVNATDISIPNFLDNYTTEDIPLRVVMDAFLRAAQKIESVSTKTTSKMTVLNVMKPTGKNWKKFGKKGKETRKCYFCKTVGHLSRDCFKKRKSESGEADASSGKEKKLRMNQDDMASKVTVLRANVISSRDGLAPDPAALYIENGQHARTNGDTMDIEMRCFELDFILDSASHVHVCNDFHAFRSVDSERVPLTWMSSNAQMQTTTGMVVVSTDNLVSTGASCNLYLTCHLVRDSDYNILSQAKLVRDFNMRVAYSEDMKSCYLKRQDPPVILKFVQGVDGFYHLEANVVPDFPFQPAPQVIRNFQVRIPDPPRSLMEWHYALGHAHFGAIKEMEKNGQTW
jgi:hypothetical protein